MNRCRRIAALCRFQCHGLAFWAALLAAGTVLTVVVSFVTVAWDGERLVVLGVPLDDFGVRGNRTRSLTRILTEGFDLLYLMVLLFLLFVALLLPLAQSFSLSHTLWLRLLPCHPLDIALARVFRLVVVVLGMAAAGVWWALMCGGYFDIPLKPLLLAVWGLVAHTLWSGGIVLLFGRFTATNVGRATLALAALMVPTVLFFGFLITGSKLPDEWRPHYPYASPFVHHFDESERHFASGAGVGVVMALASVGLAWGRVVSETQSESIQEGQRP